MTMLLDASALVPLLKHADPAKVPKLLTQAAILDLTPYEVGNALWTECRRLRQLSHAEAARLIQLFNRLWPHITLYTLDQASYAEAWIKALREEISFYDASYIEAARTHRAQLVTDDSRLRQVAAKYVKASSSKDFAGRTQSEA